MARADPPRDESARGDPLRDGLKHNPFAKLRPRAAGTADDRPDSTESPDVPSRPRPKSAPPQRQPPAESGHDPGRARDRVVIRRERKGHAGKALTIVEGPGLAAHDLAALAREAARSLGTGARVEDGALVVQGEQTERVIAWLSARGFTSLARGN